MEKKRLLRRIKQTFYVVSAWGLWCVWIYQVYWPVNMTQRLQYLEDMCLEDCQKEQAKQLVREAQVFPVTPRLEEGAWCYEDSYGDARTYGGNRQHEGIDIMAIPNQPESLNILSVCDGTVEQIGWLTLGGYRVGIRSKEGFYYYYAHMERYAPGIEPGKKVRAGTCLGYVGNTGYGKEGTKGKFPVHLHFGIYYTDGEREKSVNPYALLQYLEKRHT